jgi:hypothetical protein
VLDGIFGRRNQKVIVNYQVMGKPLDLTYHPSQGENKYLERDLGFISPTIENREGLKRCQCRDNQMTRVVRRNLLDCIIDDLAPELLAKALD